jgi:hypothetical protein
MAKFCDVCKREYPEEQQACPYCAAAAHGEAAVDLGQHPAHGPGEPPSSTSGVSAVDWAALVEEPTESPSSSGHQRGPDSAIDLGASPSPGESASGSGVSAVDWAALPDDSASGSGSGSGEHEQPPAVPQPPPPAEPPHAAEEAARPEEVVDLFGEARGGEEATIPPSHPAEVHEPAAEAPSEPTLAAGAEVVDLSDSGVELGAEAVVTESSSIHLGEPAAAAPEPPSESGIDLGEIREPDSGLQRQAPPPPADSGIDLGGMAEAPGASGSGVVDLEAAAAAAREASSSAVDLGSAAEVEWTQDQPSKPQIDLAGAAAEEPSGEPAGRPSSAEIDLGSTHDVEWAKDPGSRPEIDQLAAATAGADVVDLEGLPEVPPSGAPAAPVQEPSPSAVDLGAQPEIDPLAAASPPPKSSDSAINLSEIEAEEAAEEAPEEAVVSEETAAYEGSGAVSEEAAEAVEQEAVEEEAVQEAAEETAAEEAPQERELVGAGGPPPKAAGRGGAWLGGGVLGAVIGVVIALALWLFGVEPPDSWRLAGGSPKPSGQQGGGAAQPRPFVPPVAEPSPQEHLKRGDMEKAVAALEKAPAANAPETLAMRGEGRWLLYVQKQSKAGAELKDNDPDVQKAIEDLKQAGEKHDPNALYWLGKLQEMTRHPDQAKQTYRKALDEFKDKKGLQRRFQGALDRLEAEAPEEPAGAWLPPDLRNDPAALAALLLIAVQPPPDDNKQAPPADDKKPAVPPAEADTDEAGYDFWLALKLARTGKYADAVKALDSARNLHKTRRFSHLRQAQNPLSDPTEEIFLAATKQLKEYWQAQEKLEKAGYLNMAKRDVGKAVDEVVKKASEGGGAGAKAVADRLIKEKIIKEPADVEKGVEQLLADRKDAQAKEADLKKMVDASKEEAKDLADKLKKASDDLAKANAGTKEAQDREAKLKEDLTKEEKSLKDITDALTAAKFLDPKAGKAGALKAVQNALHAATTADPTGVVRDLRARADRDAAALKQRWTPAEMLAVWLAALQKERTDKDLAARAGLDAQRVLDDSSATAADRARAEVVRGLALRNVGKFDAAKAALEKGGRALDGAAGSWKKTVTDALDEVNNPGASLTRRAQALTNEGNAAEALTMLGQAIETAGPKEKPALQAQRSLLALDAARAGVKGPPGDSLLAMARKDAAAAAAAGLHEGLYAAGRVAEESGQFAQAADYYRQALEAHRAADAAGSRYRVALARVLLQPREGRPAAAPPAPARAPEGDKVGKAPADVLHFVAMLMTLTLQPPEAGGPDREEAERLADEVLQLPPDEVPFDVRAQALAVKGRWTQALTTYVQGLRGQLAPGHIAALLDLLRNHPRLQRSDGLTAPNPLEAEKHYAAGLNSYFDRDYPAAERSFLAAVESSGQDARYFYFLGLSRLALGNRRAALEDFSTGAQLEAANKPSLATVSAALERVQGPMRQFVNDVRNRAR